MNLAGCHFGEIKFWGKNFKIDKSNVSLSCSVQKLFKFSFSVYYKIGSPLFALKLV